MNRSSFNEDAHLNSSNAIWDDGEWVSWEEISRYIDEPLPGPADNRGEASEESRKTVKELLEELELLISEAEELISLGTQHLVNFGEMGELYAEIRYGLKRHRKYAQGSDGRIGNDFVEVKTITPWKSKDRVSVRRQGHFNKLVVVKIDEHFSFDARMVSRAKLPKGSGGKNAKISWSSMPKNTAS
ncbi:hypothetical protein MASR2M8_04110 [Opitutaceae bacterium]